MREIHLIPTCPHKDGRRAVAAAITKLDLEILIGFQQKPDSELQMKMASHDTCNVTCNGFELKWNHCHFRL